MKVAVKQLSNTLSVKRFLEELGPNRIISICNDSCSWYVWYWLKDQDDSAL